MNAPRSTTTKAALAASVAPLCLILLASACKKSEAPDVDEGPAYAAPAGRRGFSLSVDKSQTQFLKPGDAVELTLLMDSPRADGTRETRPEVIAARAEVLRLRKDWAEDTGLVQLALSPEEAQLAALAVDREDQLLLDKLPEAAKGLAEPRAGDGRPAVEPGHRGLAVLVYPDQQEFLSPGERVDVIAARQSTRAGGKPELAAITLLQDVLVLGAEPPEGNEEWSTVQLMLTPEQVKLMTRAVAGEDHLTLAVRAHGDAARRPIEPARASRRFGTDADSGSPKS